MAHLLGSRGENAVPDVKAPRGWTTLKYALSGGNPGC
jgi:hypothetical protein